MNPCRSESDAYRIAVGFALLTGASLLLGALAAPALGYAVFGAAVVGALLFVLVGGETERGKRPALARESWRPKREAGTRQILVLAEESLAGAELREEILRHARGAKPELIVVAPPLPSRSHYWASDLDHELDEAFERLEATLAWAAAQGFEAIGEVGDPDPLTAIEDELRRYGADELLIATHPPERANWLETGLVARVRQGLSLPVTHVIVDREHERVEIEPSARRAA